MYRRHRECGSLANIFLRTGNSDKRAMKKRLTNGPALHNS